MSSCERSRERGEPALAAAGGAKEGDEVKTRGRKKSSGWTPDRRTRASLAIQTWKPWLSATGPVTPEGKRKSSMNRDRGGVREKQRAACRQFKAAMSGFDLALLELAQWRWLCAQVDAGIDVTEEGFAAAVFAPVNLFDSGARESIEKDEQKEAP